MIIVFDTSVWISALEFGGVPLEVLDLTIGRFQIAVCEPILFEIHGTLARKFGWPPKNIDEALAVYARGSIVIESTGTLKSICRDPKDDMVLECAVLAEADFIISGDKDLLTISSFQGIRILTPRDFLDEFAPANQP